MNSGIGNGSASDNFDYYDKILIRIIKKYYPDLRNEKELELLSCVGWTMKDTGWTVSYAPEVETRMTLNLPLLELEPDYRPTQEEIRKKLTLYEYEDILSNLIGKGIVREKMLFTAYGSLPDTLIKYDRYLTFTNEDIINEILANSEALEYATKSFIDMLNNYESTKSQSNEKERKKRSHLLASIIIIIS